MLQLYLHSPRLPVLPLMPFFISFIRSLLLYRLLLLCGGDDPINFLSDDGLLLSVLCENPFSPIYEGPRGERYSFNPVLFDLSSSFFSINFFFLLQIPSFFLTYLSMIMSR